MARLRNCIVVPFVYDRTKPEASASANIIRAIIAAKTDRTVGQVSIRDQLTYMLAYLSSDQVGAKTIIVEFEYVDRHYFEDFAEYYSRCFAYKTRMCARIHFLSVDMEEREFIEGVRTKADDFQKHLQKHYLGFCTIRPMPETYLGRINIVPYQHLVEPTNGETALITKSTDVNLFGIPLTVDTIGLREQDRVLSACATSAIWVALSGYGNLSATQMPSLSAITKVASEQESPNGRVFPSNGLTPTQITYCLRQFGLEPTYIEFSDADRPVKSVLQRWCNAYLSARIPVLIGGRVLKVKETGVNKNENRKTVVEIGDHYVCALGFRKDHAARSKVNDDANFPESSADISKLFVHDDRFGQYLSIELDTKPLTIVDNEGEPQDVDAIPISFGFSSDSGADQYFLPTNLVVGTDHKIRVSYKEVVEIINSFAALLESVDVDLKPMASGKVSHDFGDLPSRVVTVIDKILSAKWDVRLCGVNDYKTQMTGGEGRWISSMGSAFEDLMIANLPKNIWVCEIRDNRSALLMQLLFDTTEPLQGDVFLGYVVGSDEFEALWISLRNDVNSPVWEERCRTISPEVALNLRSIQTRLLNSDALLDSLFGHPRLPRRNLKLGEFDSTTEVVDRADLIAIPPHDGVTWSLALDRKKTYIWVVDESGFLIVGEDLRKKMEDGSGDYEFQGHPTLIDYQPARLGGELWFGDLKDKNKVASGWWLNSASGAYSGHLFDHEIDQKFFLQNVIDRRFNGFKTVHDKQPIRWTSQRPG